MTAHDLVLISTDLSEAERLIRKTNNPQNINLLGYFSVQAIEKSLNVLLQTNPHNDRCSKCIHSHNVTNKLLNIGITHPKFLQNHPYITQNAKNLSACNGLRFGQTYIDLSDAMDIFKAAKELYSELLAEYQKTQPDEKKMLDEARREHFQTRQIKFNKGVPSRD